MVTVYASWLRGAGGEASQVGRAGGTAACPGRDVRKMGAPALGPGFLVRRAWVRLSSWAELKVRFPPRLSRRTGSMTTTAHGLETQTAQGGQPARGAGGVTEAALRLRVSAGVSRAVVHRTRVLAA